MILSHNHLQGSGIEAYSGNCQKQIIGWHSSVPRKWPPVVSTPKKTSPWSSAQTWLEMDQLRTCRNLRLYPSIKPHDRYPRRRQLRQARHSSNTGCTSGHWSDLHFGISRPTTASRAGKLRPISAVRTCHLLIGDSTCGSGLIYSHELCRFSNRVTNHKHLHTQLKPIVQYENT